MSGCCADPRHGGLSTGEQQDAHGEQLARADRRGAWVFNLTLIVVLVLVVVAVLAVAS